MGWRHDQPLSCCCVSRIRHGQCNKGTLHETLFEELFICQHLVVNFCKRLKIYFTISQNNWCMYHMVVFTYCFYWLVYRYILKNLFHILLHCVLWGFFCDFLCLLCSFVFFHEIFCTNFASSVKAFVAPTSGAVARSQDCVPGVPWFNPRLLSADNAHVFLV